MALEKSAYSAASPFEYEWTTASQDLTSTTANTAPMIFPQGELDCGAFLNLCFSQDSTTAAPTFHLLLGDEQLADGEGSKPTVLRRIEIKPQPTSRNVNADNSGGQSLLVDTITDIRGLTSWGENRRWYLALTNIDTATSVRLLRYHISKIGS